MLKNPQRTNELRLLAEAQDWKTLSAWFGQYEDEEDMLDRFFLWCHFVLPHYFTDKSPLFHRELARAYFSNKDEYEAAPRGFSKTTIFQAAGLFECCYELETFIVFIEKTFTEAAEVLGAMREECVSNDMVRQLYGDMLTNSKSKRAEGSKTKDAEGDVVINGVRLRGKGFDSSVRGLKSGENRPSKIVCDDLEKDEHINNPEQRLKYEERLNKQVKPALAKEGKLKMFGTILHEDSLLTNQVRLHKGKIYRAYYLPSDNEWEEIRHMTNEIVVPGIGKVRLLWGSRWDWDTLMAKKKDMMSSGGSANAFEQEYRNYPTAEEERKFKWAWLYNDERKVSLDELFASGRLMNGYAAIDTADSTTVGSDFTALVVHFVDTEDNRYRVDVRNERRNVNGLIDLIFEVWEAWYRKGLVKIGVEKKAFNDQVKPLLEQAKRERQVYPVVEELKPLGRSKENRILGNLQGRYERGKVWSVTDANGSLIGDTNTLLSQLYNFPSSKHDDLCFVAGTMVLTTEGNKPIETVVAGDMVITRKGPRKVLSCGTTGKSDVVCNIGLTGTKYHPVFVVGRGLVPLVYVNASDILYTWNEKRSSIEERSFIDTLRPSGVISGFIFGITQLDGALSRFIGSFGRSITGRFPRGMSSTTLTGTVSTTTSPTSSSSANPSTCDATCETPNESRQARRPSRPPRRPQESGTQPQKDESGIGGTPSDNGRERSRQSKSPASSAAGRSSVSRSGEGSATRTVRCETGIVASVYNLKVEGESEYFANGILVHNCDAESYVAEMAVVPYADEERSETHREPMDDPFESKYMGYHDTDADPY